MEMPARTTTRAVLLVAPAGNDAWHQRVRDLAAFLPAEVPTDTVFLRGRHVAVRVAVRRLVQQGARHIELRLVEPSREGCPVIVHAHMLCDGCVQQIMSVR